MVKEAGLELGAPFRLEGGAEAWRDKALLTATLCSFPLLSPHRSPGDHPGKGHIL